MHLCKRFLGALLTGAMVLTALVAYTAPAAAQNYSSGMPGVANVSVANGGVVIIRGDSGQQVGATINAPLMPGDTIATGSNSLAEVQFDGTSMVRLASNTQVRFVNLSPGSREMQLGIGTVDMAELQGSNGGLQLDTPSLTVRPNQNGDTRVSVLNGGQTDVTVRSGSATVADANGSQTLTPGSTLVAYGNSVRMQGPVGFDSFDQFNISRDQAMVSSYNANPYLSPQMAGYSNFANYGQWQNVPGYGEAWAPNNQSQTNFAPYQNGQWVWEPGYGYTWVDNAPYGYATSHYGSWFNNPSYGGWNWQPPSSQYQTSTGLASAFLPAVVSLFLSGSNGGGIGNLLSGLLGGLGNSSNANIGWIPLAPGEQYQPWYGQNYSYPSTSLAPVSNVTNIYNYYSNARVYRGVTMVPVSAWRNGTFRHLMIVRPQQLKQIVLVRGAVPIVPTTFNLRYSRTVVLRHPIVISRTFTTTRLATRAPDVTRFTFKTQQAKITSIASVKPKVVTLPPRPVKLEHPVYHPVAHPPVHLTVIKPVHATVKTTPVMKPVHTATPVMKPVHTAAPVMKPVHTATPVMKPVHTATPVMKPVHTAAPVMKPVHTATPVMKPVHTATPVPKPVHTATPVPKPVHIAPVVHPVHTAAPVPKPVHIAPVVHPMHTPAPHPVAKPAPAKPAPAKPAASPKPKPTR